MSLEYNVNPNDSVLIRLQLATADTGLFPQTKIYAIDDTSTVVDTVNLDEIGNGLYGTTWTNDGVRKKYFTQTIVYTDSGYTSVHPLIRPDSDSINVGFNTTGGVVSLGAKAGGKVNVDRLTKKEIEAIAKEVFEVLKPELDKKSEFNPAQDEVKTNIEIPKVEIPYIPTTEEIGKVIKVLLDSKEQTIVNTIKQNKPEIPKPTDYSEKLNSISREIQNVYNQVDAAKLAANAKVTATSADKLSTLVDEFKSELSRYKVLLMIHNNEDPAAIFQELKSLPRKDIEKMLRGVLSKSTTLTKQLAQIAKR